VKSWPLGSTIKCMTVFLARSNEYNFSPDTLHISLIRVFWTSVTVRVYVSGLTHQKYSYHTYVVHFTTPCFPTRSGSGTSSAYCSEETIEILTSPGYRDGDYITSYTCPLMHNPGWAFKAKILALPSFLSIVDDVFSTKIFTSVATTLK
jgi:hypothetical protein